MHAHTTYNKADRPLLIVYTWAMLLMEPVLKFSSTIGIEDPGTEATKPKQWYYEPHRIACQPAIHELSVS